MHPGAENVDLIFMPRFHDNRRHAIFKMAWRDQYLPLHVFKMTRRHDNFLPLANIVSRLHQNLFPPDDPMMPLVIHNILQFESIRNPRVNVPGLHNRGDPHMVTNSAIRRLNPNLIHMIHQHRCAWLRIDDYLHTKIREMRMGARQSRPKTQDCRAGGGG
jgi:hypothetical protein